MFGEICPDGRLGRAHSIDISRVDMGHADLARRIQDRMRARLIGLAVEIGKRHGTNAKGRDFGTIATNSARLHCVNS